MPPESRMNSLSHPAAVPPTRALLLGFGTVILFISARPLFAGFGLAGNALVQWLFFFLPVVAGLTLGGYRLSESLGFRSVEPKVLVGGLMLMLGALPLNGVVAWLQSFFLTVPDVVIEAMRAQFTAQSPLGWVGVILAAAVTPAVCEELVYRGLFLKPFRGKASGWVVIGLSSLAFGALHYMPQTGFRILPAAFSGAVIAWAVWHSGSIWTGMLMHLANNTLLLSLAAVSTSVAIVSDDPSATPSVLLTAVGLGLMIAGGRMILGANGPAPLTTENHSQEAT